MAQFDWSQVAEWSSVALSYAIKGLNSNFAVAALGALAGAYAGAMGAQHIAERSKRRDTLIAELNATNSAIMLVVDDMQCSSGPQEAVCSASV
jgi:hypothetical protein